MLRTQKTFLFPIFCLLFFTLLLSSCANLPAATQAALQNQAAPETVNTSPTAPALETEPLHISYYLPEDLPAAFREQVRPPADWVTAENPRAANLAFEVSPEQPVSRWVYAAAVPFPTVPDEITSEALRAAWQGDPPAGFFPASIMVTPETVAVFTAWWGEPDADMVKVIPDDELVARAWAERTALALIPFEDIQPKWKILQVDGQNPLWKEFEIEKYPLAVPFSLKAGPGAPIDTSGISFPAANRDPSKLTTVVLTGVTALVRGTADLMETRGMNYPAQDIGQILRDADVAHINNEIPFTYRCPMPFMREDNLVFCSRPQYIELLEAIGTDVVELAGDHFQDWGADAVIESIQLYKERGMKYYGGGINLADGRKALQMEVNGNKIAFIGCNAKPPGYAGARENSPGAVHCDFDWLKQEIGRVKSEGYIPIVTFQHLEYYSYLANPILVADFEKVAADGAAIVSGSQAHQPHAVEFFQDSFLHFGLGNLFFDQYKEGLPKRQAFIDRHVIYDNRYINTELIAIQFVDLARARLMTPEERQNLLQIIFDASGFNGAAREPGNANSIQ